MNTQTTTTTVTMQGPKFSRYRSVRRAAEPIEELPPPVPPADPTLTSRAPSRYRRPTAPSAQHAPPLPALLEGQGAQSPPQQAISESYKMQTNAHSSPPSSRSPPTPRDYQGHRNVVDKASSPPVEPPSRYHQREPSRAKSVLTRPTTATSQRYDAAREEARMILEGEYDRLQKLKETQKNSERQLRAAREAEAAREKAAQDARIAQEAKAAQEARDMEQQRLAQLEESKIPDASDAAGRHKLDHFVDAPKAQVIRQPTRRQHRFITAPQNMVREKPALPQGRENVNPNAAIKVTATYDAPVSAVNAGERRVEVRMGGAENGITLPVTPNTTVKDLLNSASIVMSEPVDPRTAILVESFSQFGLERPLRRYEHIRDIMNSWDMDNQNHLVIMSESDCVATGLEKKDAPTGQPSDLEVQMFHSSKAGKWDKRWIILRADGQVTVSKRENDGEGGNICHLSDFDVYTPTRKEMKQLRPPKKLCFAVKSQQKSSMFLEGTNYVHFFATSDKQVADKWYTAVQSWRSWYLANVLGEGVTIPFTKENGLKKDLRPGTANSHDSVPYQLGSFEPLLNIDFGNMQFGETFGESPPKAGTKGHGSRPSKHSLDHGAGRRSTDGKGSIDIYRSDTQRRGSRPTRMPPSSYPTKLLSEARNNFDLGIDSDDQAFTGGGLLARSGSRRTQHGSSGNETDEQAFTGGGLLGRSSSRRAPGGSTSGQGAGTGKGKPLIDWDENAEFTDGSLLRQLQSWTVSQGDTEPKIDRQRRVEADVRIGEGY